MLLVCQAAAMCFPECVVRFQRFGSVCPHTHTHKKKKSVVHIIENLWTSHWSNAEQLGGESAIWDRNYGLGEGTLSEFAYRFFGRFPTASRASSDRGYAVFSPVIRPCKLLKHVCWKNGTLLVSRYQTKKMESNIGFLHGFLLVFRWYIRATNSATFDSKIPHGIITSQLLRMVARDAAPGRPHRRTD